jgi:hypothetical protein
METQNIQNVQDRTLSPTYPPLTGTEAALAVENQIGYYPKVVRSKKDTSVSKQHVGLISFMLLEEPKMTKQGRCLGFFKLRGNWADLEQAESKAARIVREQDSKYKIRVVDVGEWLPLIDDDKLVKKNVNINLDANDEEKLREDAARKEEEKKRQHMREMKEREEEIKSAKDYNDDEKSLDFYTMKRVAWLRMRENIEQLENQKISIEKKVQETRELLNSLELDYPDYREAWIDNYNRERRKAGIPDYTPSQREEAAYSAPRPGTYNSNN